MNEYVYIRFYECVYPFRYDEWLYECLYVYDWLNVCMERSNVYKYLNECLYVFVCQGMIVCNILCVYGWLDVCMRGCVYGCGNVCMCVYQQMVVWNEWLIEWRCYLYLIRKVITLIEKENIEDDIDIKYIQCASYQLSTTISLRSLSHAYLHLFDVRSLYTIFCSVHARYMTWQFKTSLVHE